MTDYFHFLSFGRFFLWSPSSYLAKPLYYNTAPLTIVQLKYELDPKFCVFVRFLIYFYLIHWHSGVVCFHVCFFL